MTDAAATEGLPPGGDGERGSGVVSGGASADGTTSYAADRVAWAARAQDPGLPEETARELAVYAWEHLRALHELDAPAVARMLMADHPEAGASPAAVVAKAAVDFCEEHGITP